MKLPMFEVCKSLFFFNNHVYMWCTWKKTLDAISVMKERTQAEPNKPERNGIISNREINEYVCLNNWYTWRILCII